MEIVKNVNSINVDDTLSRLNTYYCIGGLSLSMTPSATILINLWYSFLLRQSSSEIKETYSIELHIIVQFHLVWTIRHIHYELIIFLSLASEMVIEIMLEIGILLKRVE